ncbi:hypothetical protein KCG48_05015 [Proteiniclasticum sp. BAD-10]|uniref:Uncharacterized protein n=1 Tax=Proteiniclasticum sediminis TaxID=2804028 RepID=A0A941CN18_9CLOT|nr:hypothetical protein [Proteiniclasticum sediminis]MBR0575701.1 hypothetical protein [Proteiniclasticum sediminis]
MSKYRLYITSIEDYPDTTIECSTAQEALLHKHEAEEQGHIVTIKRIKEEKE